MNPRVLIVEDEAAIRLALSGLLRREGYDVEQADAGEAAIARGACTAAASTTTARAAAASVSGAGSATRSRSRAPRSP